MANMIIVITRKRDDDGLGIYLSPLMLSDYPIHARQKNLGKAATEQRRLSEKVNAPKAYPQTPPMSSQNADAKARTYVRAVHST
jgi:hypothetical protein